MSSTHQPEESQQSDPLPSSDKDSNGEKSSSVDTTVVDVQSETTVTNPQQALRTSATRILRAIRTDNAAIASIVGVFNEVLTTDKYADDFRKELQQHLDASIFVSAPFQLDTTIYKRLRSVLQNVGIDCQTDKVKQNAPVGVKLLHTIWKERAPTLIQHYYEVGKTLTSSKKPIRETADSANNAQPSTSDRNQPQNQTVSVSDTTPVFLNEPTSTQAFPANPYASFNQPQGITHQNSYRMNNYHQYDHQPMMPPPQFPTMNQTLQPSTTSNTQAALEEQVKILQKQMSDLQSRSSSVAVNDDDEMYIQGKKKNKRSKHRSHRKKQEKGRSQDYRRRAPRRRSDNSDSSYSPTNSSTSYSSSTSKATGTANNTGDDNYGEYTSRTDHPYDIRPRPPPANDPEANFSARKPFQTSGYIHPDRRGHLERNDYQHQSNRLGQSQSRIDFLQGKVDDDGQESSNQYQKPESRSERQNGSQRNHSGGLRSTQNDESQSFQRQSNPFDTVFNVRKTILSIYNRNSKNHFSGSIEESWMDHLNDFLALCQHPNVSEENQLELLKYTLRGNALSHYRAMIRDGNTWNELTKDFEELFLATDSREEVSEILAKLRLKDFKDDGKTDGQALQALIRRIQDLIPVAAVRDNDEMTKCKYLIKAVGNHNWSSFAQSNLEAPYNFIKLGRKMYKSIRLFGPAEAISSSPFSIPTKRVNYIKDDDRAGEYTKEEAGYSTDSSCADNQQPAEINFAGQQRVDRRGSSYAQEDSRKGNQNFTGGRRDQYAGARKKHDNLCFNCDKPGHYHYQCRSPKNESKIKLKAQEKSRQFGFKNGISRIHYAELLDSGLSHGLLKAIYIAEIHDVRQSMTEPETSTTSPQANPIQPDPSTVSFVTETLNPAPMISFESDVDDCFFVSPSPSSNDSQPCLTTGNELASEPHPHHNSEILYQNIERDTVRLPNILAGSAMEILSASSVDVKNHPKDQFIGFCVDSGAAVSTVGLPQLKSYCDKYKVTLSLAKERAAFAFGETVHDSLGSFICRMPLPNNRFLNIHLSVVKINIPLLVGLDVMRKHRLILDYDVNKFKGINPAWEIPFTFINNHSYVVPSSKSVFFTRSELEKLHQQFVHPPTERLYQTIKRADPTTSPTIKSTLDQIVEACKVCKEFHSPPFRFRASLPPDDIIFNQELSIDLMWLSGRPVLHVVDTHTGYQNAVFVKDKTTETLWDHFLTCWTTVYIGYPKRIRLDQERSFLAEHFQSAAEIEGIELQFSGVESHNSIASGETYHHPLRRIFLKLKAEHNSVDDEFTLRLSVKAINDTAGPSGLSPSMLVYGVAPAVPALNRTLPAHADRMEALTCAQREMATIHAENRIRRALSSKLPPATKFRFEVGDNVRVYREDSHRWEGPHRIQRIERKLIWVMDGTRVKPFNVTSVIPAEAKENDRQLERFIANHTSLQTVNNHLTELLKPTDPRCNSPTGDEAKKEEIFGLMARNCFKVVNRDNLFPSANLLGGRFVMAIKNVGTSEEKMKARYVVQGHRDKEKGMLIHNSPTLRHRSVRMVLSVAGIMEFKIWTQDVAQAYIQSQNLTRDVYIKPHRIFGLDSSKVLKLEKPLYGLPDAGDYWADEFSSHVTGLGEEDLNMEATLGDLSLYFKMNDNGVLCGVLGLYVDDSIGAGDAEFEEFSKRTERRFDSKPRELTPFTFAGMEVESTNGLLNVHQRQYIGKINHLPPNAMFDSFRSLRHQLAWLSNCRPDVVAGVNILSQVTEQKFSKIHVTEINRIVKHLKSNPSLGLAFPQLDINSLRIVAFTDGSFANTEDLSSQIGFVIFVQDGSGNANCIEYSSKKSRRVVRSVLGSEIFAFADAVDVAILVRHDLQQILGRSVDLRILTDSSSLFDVITKSSTTTEKRLMIDISAARQAYQRGDITEIGWLRREYNVADSLTKFAPGKGLTHYMNTGILHYEIEKLAVRDLPTLHETWAEVHDENDNTSATWLVMSNREYDSIHDKTGDHDPVYRERK